MRLDAFLVEQGMVSSREKAKELIINKHVLVNEHIELKPSYQVKDSDQINVEKQAIIPYVSRGGLKLEKAIREFKVNFTSKTVLDIGASTGGFTDCALKHGASFVWAVDVGTNQLDNSLKNNSKVKSLENCDIRKLDVNTIENQVDIIVADLSFISLTYILDHLPKFLKPEGICILLIKPQFEAGISNIGKGGLVKSEKVHIKILNDIKLKSKSTGLYLTKLTHSPISDIKKNIEYLGLFSLNRHGDLNIKNTVENAFKEQNIKKGIW